MQCLVSWCIFRLVFMKGRIRLAVNVHRYSVIAVSEPSSFSVKLESLGSITTSFGSRSVHIFLSCGVEMHIMSIWIYCVGLAMRQEK